MGRTCGSAEAEAVVEDDVYISNTGAAQTVSSTKQTLLTFFGAFTEDNKVRAIYELQIKLYSYRKVVLKRFCDTVIGYTRLAFPRYLRMNLLKFLMVRYITSEDTDMDGQESSDPSLIDLVCEDPCLQERRAELQASMNNLRSGLKILTSLRFH
jgi:hypothetical protein